MEYRKILVWGLTLLAFTACRKPSVEEGVRISFASLARDAQTSTKTGAGETVVLSDSVTMRSQPFGIYGLYSPDPGAESGTNVFLSTNAQEVSYQTSSWEYDPLAYWSINQYYRFRAYHPYSGSAFNVLNSSSVDLISIDYKIASGSEDLMFAFWTGKADESVIASRVPMAFSHALSGLRFKIGLKDSEDIDDSASDEVTSFWISGIIPNGTVLYTHPEGRYDEAELVWIAENYDASTRYYEWSGSKSFSKVTDSNPATAIFDGTDHVVFAIPQNSSGAKGPTKAYFTTTKGGDAVNEITLPAVKWEPGVIYEYTFIISQSKIEVEIRIKDWELVEINEDIHIL
ncbi:MAG: fimbrillin family protein [Candidatus Cryptobacteroides sp.]